MGAEWVIMGAFCSKPMEGEAEIESLILWFAVLELLAGGWWWRGGCLTICQKCLPCPASRQIQLNVGAW